MMLTHKLHKPTQYLVQKFGLPPHRLFFELYLLCLIPDRVTFGVNDETPLLKVRVTIA